LDAQIGNGNAKSFIINSAYQRMTVMAQTEATRRDGLDTGFPEGITTQGSKGLIFIYKEGRNISSDPPMWNGINRGPIHPWLKSFLENYYGALPARLCYSEVGREAHWCVQISAEYTRGSALFRAHLNYCQGGPWYDWAMFRWAKEGGRSEKNCLKSDSCVHYGDPASTAHWYTYAPGKILWFVSTDFL
jgi:hypothetical protein